MFAKVILASKPTNGAPPIITMHWRYPRIIHAEVMTHRKKSKNARSSRAVPVATMLKEIKSDPFVPWHLGKNQKGMQAGESFPPADVKELQNAWLVARDNAVASAEGMMDFGVHKQVANRLLEPFMWMDTLITSTNWSNFLHLRNHGDAEPHFQDLAGLVETAINGAEYQNLAPGEWHLPYIAEADYDAANTAPDENSADPGIQLLQKISAARCARISYAPFDGDPSFEREIERYNGLVSSSRIHASPLEHQATPDTQSEFFRCKKSTDPKDVIDPWKVVEEGMNWDHPELSGNLDGGWIQFRKTVPGEYVAA